MLGSPWLAKCKRRLSFGRIRRVARDRRGSSAVEFALVAPVLFLTMVGTMEVGTILFVDHLVEGAVRDASRFGITGLGATETERIQTVRNIIDNRTLGLVDVDNAEINTLIYNDFQSIGEPEPYTDNSPANGAYDVGEAYDDVNGNGVWDNDQGAVGAGDSDEIVLYRIRYDLDLLTGMLDHVIGQDGVISMEASIAVRNEPFRTDDVLAGG